MRTDMKAAAEIGRQLQVSEAIIWSGMPKQGLLLRRGDLLLVPFSFLWGGFALFWEWTVLTTGAPLFMALFGLPFVLVAVYITFGRFVVDAWMRASTFYGLTNQRVILLSGMSARSVKSISLIALDEVSVTEKKDRSGTIVFGRPHPFAQWYAGASSPGMSLFQPVMFESIPDAKRVHDQVLQAQRMATGR